jgi:hypothetical protein
MFISSNENIEYRSCANKPDEKSGIKTKTRKYFDISIFLCENN